ncbi:MerR family DNA-binding transcriptional regulator [Xanthobacteraceae bacterium Astr-EGSB]|uniref:MerR family transcriptional regulator n=1 Tax=Astrobacterium formosum TaxID=3069710 RepID=UPI0027B631B6|nr:MerR family DNA-binding transcriptional regulator [Xanthobacteraceae bacterium Astr-EGSB]
MIEQKGVPGMADRLPPWNPEGAGLPSAPGQKAFSIGDLAREFGVTLRALRFYESKGLLKPQREGNLRLYSPADRENLAQILKGKQLGFTLSEIRSLIASDTPDCQYAPRLKLSREQCVEQIKLLERQKKEIEDAIAELRRTYTDLYTRTPGD